MIPKVIWFKACFWDATIEITESLEKLKEKRGIRFGWTNIDSDFTDEEWNRSPWLEVLYPDGTREEIDGNDAIHQFLDELEKEEVLG